MADEDEREKFLGSLEGALDNIGKKGDKQSRQEEIEKQLVMADVMRREFISPEDPDFAEKLAPYMAGEIDPSAARHLQPELPKDSAMALWGSYNSDDETIVDSHNVDGKRIQLMHEPGMVNAVHTRNNPQTWAHEFRHRNYPELREMDNRGVDLVAAQTDIDRDDAIRMYANAIRKSTPSDSFEAIEKLFRNLKNPYLDNTAADVIEAETGRDAEEVAAESLTAQLLKDAKDLDKWNEGLKERNTARREGKPETIADMIRRLWGDK